MVAIDNIYWNWYKGKEAEYSNKVDYGPLPVHHIGYLNQANTIPYLLPTPSMHPGLSNDPNSMYMRKPDLPYLPATDANNALFDLYRQTQYATGKGMDLKARINI